MDMNETPRSERIHISFFGRRNVGKSSLVNALTGQDIAVVSPVKGTTTDPVYKAMELLPLGPVVMIDTAGLDDAGDLGKLRIKKTMEVLNKTDLALVVFDNVSVDTKTEKELLAYLKENKIPTIGVFNKADTYEMKPALLQSFEAFLRIPLVRVSAKNGDGIEALRRQITGRVPVSPDKFTIVGDLVSPGDLVVLVVPIDKAAPKGRLILPQQQTIRDILESDAMAIVTKEHELKDTLQKLGRPPRLVITDSQVFLKAAADTPKDIPITSFSILFARSKGRMETLLSGVKMIDRLKDGDKILIAEACTHHRQADDIGRVKIPRWLRQRTGKVLHFDFCSGTQFPEALNGYTLVVHCGGCMLNRTAMKHRIEQVVRKGVPIVNYGILIAYLQGVLERAISPFPLAKMLWEEQTRGLAGGYSEDGEPGSGC